MKLNISIALCALLYFDAPAFSNCSVSCVKLCYEHSSNPYGRLRRASSEPTEKETDLKTVCEAYFAGLLECDYQPLCATDDNAYDNVCALCEKIKSNSPEIRHDGKC
ncbi:thrombin inhibitor rhodniin-like [Alosa sapidissima]|uniref:thrombin inhibitor rhodniin-like n=1 Tax=Alosa sapidissima TaxID=34773 RepID=UPI001C08036F|nr:thrombin inhibitor rhodniin-like [Alosa sapidissima]